MSSSPRTEDSADIADVSLAEEVNAERLLVRRVITGVAAAVPVSVAVWLGLIALAVGNKDPEWPSWLGMGAVIGVLSGVFFGAWAGFVTQTHALEEIDRHPDPSGIADGGAPAAVGEASTSTSDRQPLSAQDLTDVVIRWPGWLLEIPGTTDAVPVSRVIRVPVLHGGTRWIVHTAEDPSRRLEYEHADDPIVLIRPP
jgi:hypothetical protein